MLAQSLLSSHLLSRNVKVKIYKTIILPVALYGCETWSLTLREENRLRVFENRILRTVFGPKSDEVTGEWRKLHNEELHSVYSSPDIIRQVKSMRMRWAGYVTRMGEERKVYKVLVGKPEGKRPLGRQRRRWEMGSECVFEMTNFLDIIHRLSLKKKITGRFGDWSLSPPSFFT
jgi:hypothetical protein